MDAIFVLIEFLHKFMVYANDWHTRFLKLANIKSGSYLHDKPCDMSLHNSFTNDIIINAILPQTVTVMIAAEHQ